MHVLGLHKGIIHYTVGQRKGLGLSLGYPAYVKEIRNSGNEVVIGREHDLYTRTVICEDINLMSIASLKEKMRCTVKIRYQHAGQEEEDRETALPGTDRQTELPDRKLVFESLDHIIRFAGLLQKNTLYSSTLFKSDRQYVLLVRFDRCESNKDALAFILTAEEYGGVCSPVHYDEAYMMEHGRDLIRDNALEVLAGM